MAKTDTPPKSNGVTLDNARALIARMQAPVAEDQGIAYLGRNVVVSEEGEWLVIRVLADALSQQNAPRSKGLEDPKAPGTFLGGKSRTLATTSGGKRFGRYTIGLNVGIPLAPVSVPVA